MSDAEELLLSYLSNISEPGKTAALFASDGVLDIPSLSTIGISAHLQGPAQIEGFIRNLLDQVPDFKFHHIQVHITTPDQVFAEYEVEATTTTGRPFTQLYSGRLVAENGKIKLLSESLNLVLAARAMLPNGVSDIPA